MQGKGGQGDQGADRGFRQQGHRRDKLVGETGEVRGEIVIGVKKVTEVVAEIAASSGDPDAGGSAAQTTLIAAQPPTGVRQKWQ